MTGGRESSTWLGETKMTMVKIAQEEVKRLGDSLFLRREAQWVEKIYCSVCFMLAPTAIAI